MALKFHPPSWLRNYQIFRAIKALRGDRSTSLNTQEGEVKLGQGKSHSEAKPGRARALRAMGMRRPSPSHHIHLWPYPASSG